MYLDANTSLSVSLEMAMVEAVVVELHLRGGHTFKGRIASIGEDCVIIDPIAGREFFGAHIRIADIVAVSVQTRRA